MTNHQFETVSGSPVRGLPRPGAKGRIVLSPQDGANALRRGWGKKKKGGKVNCLFFVYVQRVLAILRMEGCRVWRNSAAWLCELGWNRVPTIGARGCREDFPRVGLDREVSGCGFEFVGS